MKNFSLKDFKKILKENNYELIRMNGSHGIYSNGTNIISIPESSKEICGPMIKRLIKENNLKI